MRRDIAGYRIDGRGTDNNQLMPVIKHQWQIAHAERPYRNDICVVYA